MTTLRLCSLSCGLQNGFAKTAGAGAAVALAGYLVGKSKAAEAIKAAEEVGYPHGREEKDCLQAWLYLFMNPGQDILSTYNQAVR